MFRNGANVARHDVIIDMRCFLAVTADEEDAIMMTTRMGVGDIGIRAFHAHGDVVRHEQVEDAIDAVGRHSLAPNLGHAVGNVIGRRGLFFGGERIEYRSAHGRPLLVLSFQRVAGCVGQACASRFVMVMVFGHMGQSMRGRVWGQGRPVSRANRPKPPTTTPQSSTCHQ